MNKKILILIVFMFSVFLFSPKTNAQVCQNINAGDDVQMQCSDSDVTLTSTVIAPNYKTTRNYDVGGELLCPPITYDGSRTFIQTDDEWSDFVIDIPFTFCFFENQYDQILISGNGIVTFDLTVIDAYSSWVVADGLQLPTQEWQTNAIFGVYHDMDSGVQPREDRISYKTLGDAPNRVFVISFEAYQYSCNSLLSKSQIKLYESSNVIDVLVDEKPVCSSWNGGRAVVGIQNKSGTIGVSPPSRNNGVWTPAAGGELWRFVPNGEDMEYFLKWYDQDGNLLNSNNDESITVDPQEETTYTVELTLVDQCNDSTAIITDQVTVTPGFTPDIETPVNLVECEDPVGSGTFDFNIDQTTFVLNGLDPADFVITYHTSFADADSNSNPIITLNPYTSAGNETIYIRVEEVNDPTCYTIRSFTLTVLTQSSAVITYNPAIYCLSDSNPLPDSIATPGGTFSIDNGGVIDPATGEIDLISSGLGLDGTGNFMVTYNIGGQCPSMAVFNIEVYDGLDSSFTYPSTTCVGATVNPIPSNIATSGGVFSVDGGAIIDPNTGELDLSSTTAGNTYTVTYTLSGNCPSSSTQQIEVLLEDDPTFSYPSNQYCNNDTNPLPDLIVTPGGTFTINNGGVINSTTGEIDLMSSGLGTDGTGVFEITYTTSGACSASSTQTIRIILEMDASFTYPSNVCIADANPTPSVVETGGVFTVDGGATIDSVTGELDLTTTTEGADYTITYSFSGICPSSSQQIVHVDDSPTANAPTTVLNSCDNGNGSANFDILSIESEIIGSQTDVTVTYHATQADAELGVNAMETNPFLIATGNVWARVVNLQGCAVVVEVPLTIENCILIIPEGFSPSSNVADNQTFNIPSIRTKYPKFEIYIYNRYGNEVYKGDVNTDNWNGKLKNDGELLPTGTYFYGIKLNDNQDISYRGWVYLQY
jgi:gliding motility-associated-like protein